MQKRMKTNYIKPDLEVVDVEMAQMIAASQIEIGESKKEGTTDVNGHRGTWGNLWD